MKTFFVDAFIKGLRVGNFGESLMERKLENTVEVRKKARSHIDPEEVMMKKERK